MREILVIDDYRFHCKIDKSIKSVSWKDINIIRATSCQNKASKISIYEITLKIKFIGISTKS